MTRNPWEQSRSFKRFMKLKSGPSFTYPEPGGESVSLAAPSKHKLFIKYCPDCTGIMSVVRSWNIESEDALKFRLEHQIQDAQNIELRKLTQSMNVIIEKQEAELVEVKAKNKVLEEGNDWFQKW